MICSLREESSELTGQRSRINLILIVVLGALLALVIFLLVRGRGASTQTAAEEGLAYLQSLESRDVNAVEAKLSAIREAHLQEEREKRKAEQHAASAGKWHAQIDELMGDDTLWPAFSGSVIFGDSRTVGFSYYKYLPEERVVAKKGWTIADLEEHIYEISAISPDSLFLCTGMNDVGILGLNGPEAYAEEYLRIVKAAQEELPYTKIYVNSILPAREPALSQEEIWNQIPEFNAALKTMCSKNDITYIDNGMLSDEYADLWDVDGIHVLETFYPYWAANMLLAVYSS